MRPGRTSLQDAALVVAGALISVAVSWYSLRQPADRAGGVIGLVAILAIVLFVFGAILWTLAFRRYRLWARKGRGLIPAGIGVLYDMGWDTRDTEIFTHTNISPLDWVKEIQSRFPSGGKKVNVRLMKTKHDFSSYVAVVNPYGGVYPERDLKNADTLQQVFDYVSGGGVFVNVADMPGYYAYRPALKRRLDATPPSLIPVITPNGRLALVKYRDFEFTPFMERLGLRVLNVEGTPVAQWGAELVDEFREVLPNVRGTLLQAHRVAIVERNVKPVLKTKSVQTAEGPANGTPLFLVTYDDGYFVISLLPTHPTENADVRHLISALIAHLAK